MRKNLTVLGVAGALLLVGGVAVASIPDASGVIHGCRKNSDGSVRVIDSDLGQVCANGWTALNWSQTGPEGPAGATGPAGPAGVSGYQVVTAEIVRPSGGSVSGTLDAACPSGKKVFGGGWRSQQLDAPNLLIHWSYPDTDNNWWSIRYAVTDGPAPFTLTAYAVCATA